MSSQSAYSVVVARAGEPDSHAAADEAARSSAPATRPLPTAGPVRELRPAGPAVRGVLDTSVVGNGAERREVVPEGQRRAREARQVVVAVEVHRAARGVVVVVPHLGGVGSVVSSGGIGEPDVGRVRARPAGRPRRVREGLAVHRRRGRRRDRRRDGGVRKRVRRARRVLAPGVGEASNARAHVRRPGGVDRHVPSDDQTPMTWLGLVSAGLLGGVVSVTRMDCVPPW